MKAIKILLPIILPVFLSANAQTTKNNQTKSAAQNSITLKVIGNGEKVRLTIAGKSKIITLEGTEIGEFIAGGEPPHRFKTLLSIHKGSAFYLVAEFTSGAALSNPNAPCGGNRPTTLLLIKADRNLKVENIRTEIFASCIYNGAGRYPNGKIRITQSGIAISFDEGRKKYKLFFDADDPDKGLQLIDR